MAANKPVVQRDRQRDGGATRARLLLGAVSATLFVSMGGAQSAAGQAVTAVAATATSADCHWQVSGTWKTQTLPYHPVFKLTQDGAKISGTETFSPADAASAGFPNPTATVAGTLVGDEIDIVATFHGVLKIGRRAAGTLQAEYKGTITTGRVAGTGQDITTPNTGTVPWNGTGPAECVTRYLWTASGKAVKPSEVRVLLPELPNGGETSYRQYTGHATSYGLFETDAGGKLQNVRGKLTVSILYRRVLTGEGVPPAVAKAPLTLERTITFDTTSGQSFAPPHPVTPRGGTLRLTLKLERDNFLVCNPKDVGTLILTDEDGPNKAFRIGGFDTTCLAGGKAQSGAAAGEDLVDLRNASSISVVIRKRA